MDVRLSLRPAAAAMVLLAAGCLTSTDFSAETPSPTTAVAAAETVHADVTAVSVTREAGAYSFDVTVRSPDTGCEGYADWWEVVSPDGELLYRRVLLHSHVDEQPFSRSGGPVPIGPNDTVVVGAHMSTTGYGDVAFSGTVEGGFVAVSMPPGFAVGLAELVPLPSSCAFKRVVGRTRRPPPPSEKKKNICICEGHPHTPGPSAGSGQATGRCPSAHPLTKTRYM